jgi:hypothetical protein
VHLLNPFGTHGQGTLFLNCFLKQVGLPPRVPDADWGCEKEWVTPNGRIDILLQSQRNELIVAIENKIYSLDEATQLRRYRDWLDLPHRQRLFPVQSKRRLLYLTLNGNLSAHTSAQGVDYKCISYRHDILGFLRVAMRLGIRARQVKKAIEQYINTLELLLEETSMTDALDRRIVELALRPNHQRAALAITRCARAIENQLLRTFWDNGREFIKRQLGKSGFKYWTLFVPDDVSPHQSGYHLDFVPRDATDRPRVTVSLYQYQTEKLFRLELCVQIGACVNNATRRKVNQLTTVKSLKTALVATEMPARRTWDAYKLLTDDRKGLSKILEEEASDQRYHKSLFGDGWEWFCEFEEKFRAADEAIELLERECRS